jgi:hypothetical protein
MPGDYVSALLAAFRGQPAFENEVYQPDQIGHVRATVAVNIPVALNRLKGLRSKQILCVADQVGHVELKITVYIAANIGFTEIGDNEPQQFGRRLVLHQGQREIQQVETVIIPAIAHGDNMTVMITVRISR